jgi:hypothetical protein
MTSEDIRSETERDPFLPFRMHLVLILDPPIDRGQEGGYNIASLRNNERLEPLKRQV